MAARNTSFTENAKELQNLFVNGHLSDLLAGAPEVTVASSVEDLQNLACGSAENISWKVGYELPDETYIHEVDVVRVKNGIAANYSEPYMRRRDPECMVIADEEPSDKITFKDRFGRPFGPLREETFSWLANQKLAVFGFEMGYSALGGDALAVCPANAAFFALGLGLLQGVIDIKKLDRPFKPGTVIYVAPPFRHTHFDGKQVVVHNRVGQHEIFSYNLYPGPSAKKGVYGALIEMGVQDEWITAHCSAVQVITPYDNVVNFMHEGASGGGKSEMLQQPHRLSDGRLRVGRNIVTGDERFLELQRTCDLHPVCDDMGMCHPSLQHDHGRLQIADAEDGWFIRVNHIESYGTDHDLEGLTVAPPRPLLFLNLDVVAGGTALIWEHQEDARGRPCPNPRVILPRDTVPGVITGEVSVDIRSFGVRTPPCTMEKPTYGILGLFHVLPPALAWLWRLVAPRGHDNPSITEEDAMSSEGVGSYWPFTTGRKVDQANLLLQQFLEYSDIRYILTPNQHVGAWKTGFMPQWLARDYLARRGAAPFLPGQLVQSRCSLLGYTLRKMRIEGTDLPEWLFQTELQTEVGAEAYDRGADILRDFFHKQVNTFLQPELHDLGRDIIQCCLDGGTLNDYENLISTKNV